jgi:hypothetical protein
VFDEFAVVQIPDIMIQTLVFPDVSVDTKELRIPKPGQLYD